MPALYCARGPSGDKRTTANARSSSRELRRLPDSPPRSTRGRCRCCDSSSLRRRSERSCSPCRPVLEKAIRCSHCTTSPGLETCDGSNVRTPSCPCRPILLDHLYLQRQREQVLAQDPLPNWEPRRSPEWPGTLRAARLRWRPGTWSREGPVNGSKRRELPSWRRCGDLVTQEKWRKIPRSEFEGKT